MPDAPHSQEARAFSERLRQALDRAGVRPSPTLVANEFNLRYWGRPITPHTARTWLLGVSIPMQDKLRVLAEWLDVEPEHLRFGHSTAALARDGGPLDNRLRPAERDMLERYLRMPAEAQKTVRDVVLALSVAFAEGSAAPAAPAEAARRRR